MSSSCISTISRRLVATKPKGRNPSTKSSKSKPSTGRLYGWGLAATGSLGVPDLIAPEDTMRIPTRMLRKPNLLEFSRHKTYTDVTCGNGFTVFMTDERASRHSDVVSNVYGSGLNTMGQLGWQAGAAGGKSSQWLWRAQPISLAPCTSRVVSIGAGLTHTVCVTANAGVFCLGNNSYGQCGRRVIEDEDYANPPVSADRQPVRMALMDGDKVASVTCGLDTTILLTKRGHVFTFGCGTDGQLGTGGTTSSWQASKVQGLLEGESVIQTSCAGDTVLVLTSSGKVFGWGNNEYRQLLPEASPSVNDPVQLKVLPSSSTDRIVSVAAGGSVSAALSESGEMYVWGFGAVGLGPSVQDTEGKVHKIPEVLFSGVKGVAHAERRVVRMHAGLMHFAAVTGNGELYMWGKNRYCLLGFNEERDQDYPLKVDGIHGQVHKIGLGPDHTVVLTKPL